MALVKDFDQCWTIWQPPNSHYLMTTVVMLCYVTGKRTGHRGPVRGTVHRGPVRRTGHQGPVRSPGTGPVTGPWYWSPGTGPWHRSSGTGLVTGHLSTVTGPVTGQYHRGPARSRLPVTGYRSPVIDQHSERDIAHHLRTIPLLLPLLRQLVLTIEVDVVHDLLYRAALIHGVDMIDTDHLGTLGDVIIRDAIPIAADLFLGIAGIKLVVMLHVDNVVLTTLILYSTLLSRIVMSLYPCFHFQFPV
ncbi:hypothetical protein DPMN_084727 [Dreissena polymorpha]|uniref:Uncharacterized protein n=1 Tax=Dreissena polymorpha TaxID=45954 RepID=A0A9D3YBH7_DREPO|nr:hypothetical protein DPMN_084727 [Dreissena polymorpha]